MKKSYSSIFKDCKVRVAVSEEKDAILSLASIEGIKGLVPEIDIKGNSDLLPIAFDSCVVNRFNKNNDGINSATAVAIASNFAYKPINIEHKRTNICGVILSATFTSLSHKIMTAEEAGSTKDPYYITLGGVIWRSIKPELANYIEDCADPSSPEYESVSASWEISFEDYKICLREDNLRSVDGCEMISDPDEIQKIEAAILNKSIAKYNGKRVYRLIDGGVTPIGIGLTENPAADVKGVACSMQNNMEKDDKTMDEEASNKEKLELNEKNASKISEKEKLDVITNEKTIKIMPLQRLDQISDSGLKDGTITASAIVDFFNEKIQEADKQYQASQTSEKTVKEELSKVKADYDSLAKSNKALEEQFTALKNEVAKQKAEADFNVRMEYMDKHFALTDSSRKIIAQDLNSIASEADFNAFLEKMKALLPVKQAEVTKTPVTEEKTSVASENGKEAEKALSAALENGTPDAPKIPNATQPETNFMDTYREAFALDQFKISTGPVNKRNK